MVVGLLGFSGASTSSPTSTVASTSSDLTRRKAPAGPGQLDRHGVVVVEHGGHHVVVGRSVGVAGDHEGTADDDDRLRHSGRRDPPPAAVDRHDRATCCRIRRRPTQRRARRSAPRRRWSQTAAPVPVGGLGNRLGEHGVRSSTIAAYSAAPADRRQQDASSSAASSGVSAPAAPAPATRLARRPSHRLHHLAQLINPSRTLVFAVPKAMPSGRRSRHA